MLTSYVDEPDQRIDRARAGPVQEAESHLEAADVGCDRLRNPHGFFGCRQIQGNDDRIVCHHGRYAPTRSEIDSTPCLLPYRWRSFVTLFATRGVPK